MSGSQSICVPEAAVIGKTRVRVGSRVSKGTVIASYKVDNGCAAAPRLMKLRSPLAGVVTSIAVKQGDLVSAEQPVCTVEISSCPHRTVMKSICADCGLDLRDTGLDSSKDQNASISMIHNVPELRVSADIAEDVASEEVERLLGSRKLVLIVDLDQTLIHTTTDHVPPNLAKVHHFQTHLNGPWYHTKMRPGTEQFLSNLSQYFEMHIITFGVRLYAHIIARILDPDDKLFHHRIMARDEIHCFGVDKTANMKSLFPVGDNLVCVIDDRDDVWQYMMNVIKVPPYKFFPSTGDINAPVAVSSPQPKSEDNKKESSDIKAPDAGTPDAAEPNQKGAEKPVESTQEMKQSGEANGESDEAPKKKSRKLTFVNVCSQCIDNEPHDCDVNGVTFSNEMPTSNREAENDEEVEWADDDDYLPYLERSLMSIHESFFQQYDRSKPRLPDVKLVIAETKARVLAGCTVVFSGVIPTNFPTEKAKEFIEARALGASVVSAIDPASVTHVIAARPGTHKVSQARKHKSISIVNPDWLWTCSQLWHRVAESKFPLTQFVPEKSLRHSWTPSRSSIHNHSIQKMRTEELVLSKQQLLSEISSEIDKELGDEEDESSCSSVEEDPDDIDLLNQIESSFADDK